jgi:hypothetical protein
MGSRAKKVIDEMLAVLGRHDAVVAIARSGSGALDPHARRLVLDVRSMRRQESAMRVVPIDRYSCRPRVLYSPI